MRAASTERGSALTEAAIIFPILMLTLWWSIAMTDVMVLKLKAAEALRYALWETTVFKPPSQINSEVNAKFVDLRSPRDENVNYTGLLMYPLSRDMLWSATVTDANPVSIGGSMGDVPPAPPGIGIIGQVISWITGALSTVVDGQAKIWRFNTNGMATARVTLVHARHDEEASPILKGGNLLGDKGGNGSDLDHNEEMTNWTFQAPLPSHRPMQLIFDTWKAWPKPSAYTRDGADTDVATAPAQTYPEVERQVSKQVDKILFFGINNLPFFADLRNLVSKITGAGVTQDMMGGFLPDVFSAERMDDMNKRGPITILPPERATESWVPKTCEIAGSSTPCPNQRVGDVTGTSEQFLDHKGGIGDRVDRTRYTIPYKINTDYWSATGGIDHDGLAAARTAKIPAKYATQNEYVNTFNCRGHYFAGSQRAQETDNGKRYPARCQ